MKIVLASSSPRRKKIMDEIGLGYIVDPANIDEEAVKCKTAEELARTLALSKAETVAKRHKNSIVIGSDLVVSIQNQRIGKPRDKEDAKRILKMLRGKTHQVITAVAVIDTANGKRASGIGVAGITMKNYSDKEIDDYIATGEPMDKGGAYAIQGLGSKLIKSFSGDKEVVVGLPTKLLFKLLKGV